MSVLCGEKTLKGTPCKNKTISGQSRCAIHIQLSRDFSGCVCGPTESLSSILQRRGILLDDYEGWNIDFEKLQEYIDEQTTNAFFRGVTAGSTESIFK